MTQKGTSVAAGQQSDHLVVVAAYAGWRAALKEGVKEARQYCRLNFLSWDTLEMLKEMRYIK